jgi:hypothetical protein
MINITLKYGSQRRELTVEEGTTIGSVLSDSTNKIVLVYGDNINALIGGVTQPVEAVIPDGAEITIENRANQKAS